MLLDQREDSGGIVFREEMQFSILINDETWWSHGCSFFTIFCSTDTWYHDRLIRVNPIIHLCYISITDLISLDAHTSWGGITYFF
jgi:hypothetical protein